MANFQRYLRYRLDKYQLDLKSLNSRKNGEKKKEILDYLIKLGISENISERKLLKEIRNTGLKFSNDTGRIAYQTLYKQYGRKKTNKVGDYLGSIRKSSKPNANRLPVIQHSGKSKKYLYVAQFFFLCDDSKKERKLKKDPRLVSSYETNYFNHIQEYGIWSNTLLSRDQVEQYFIEWLNGDIHLDFDSPITGSDWSDRNFDTCEVVGFKYVRALRVENKK